MLQLCLKEFPWQFPLKAENPHQWQKTNEATHLWQVLDGSHSQGDTDRHLCHQAYMWRAAMAKVHEEGEEREWTGQGGAHGGPALQGRCSNSPWRHRLGTIHTRNDSTQNGLRYVPADLKGHRNEEPYKSSVTSKSQQKESHQQRKWPSAFLNKGLQTHFPTWKSLSQEPGLSVFVQNWHCETIEEKDTPNANTLKLMTPPLTHVPKSMLFLFFYIQSTRVKFNNYTC